MSQKQCETALDKVANTLISKRWKRFDRTLPNDTGTLPIQEGQNPKLKRAAIVNEKMKTADARVTCANNGSVMNGNYIVQSLMVHGDLSNV